MDLFLKINLIIKETAVIFYKYDPYLRQTVLEIDI